MTELRPLLESSPNPKTRELLSAGRRERPLPHAMERTAAALGVGAVLTASTATATALGGATISSAGGASVIGALSIAKWLAVGALSGTVVAGSAALVQRGLDAGGAAQSAPASAEGPARAVDEGPAPRSGEANAAIPSAFSPSVAASGTERPGAAATAAQRSPTQNLNPAEPAEAPPSENGAAAALPSGPLSIELERVDRARALLAAGNAVQALGELTEYDKIRATGTLDREAWILRIDALLNVGRRSEARELAREYLARYPRDAHAVRLRELADGG